MNNNQILIEDNCIKCNMLVLGKTGSGKSSFANYLFGTDRFLASSGKPVTDWKDNFQSHSLTISGVQVNVFDSVGLETNNHEKWYKELKQFLNEKQSLASANDIIHTLFYVINASSARIEENELTILKEIELRFKLSTAIILSNCDMATKEEIESLEKIIKNNKLEVIRICSISKKPRIGKEIKPFGKEEALKILLSSSYEKIGKDLSLIVLDSFKDHLSEIKNKMLVNVENSEISVFNITNIDVELEKVMEKFESDIDINFENLMPKSYIKYSDFLSSFNIEYQGKDYIDSMGELLTNIDFDSFIEKNSLIKRLSSLVEKFDNDSIWDKVIGVFDIGIMLVRMKNLIKEAIEEGFDSINNEIDKVKRKI